MSKQLFHYTSISAVKSIITSQVFRATNITTFEDKNELYGGMRPISCFLDKLEYKVSVNNYKNKPIYLFVCIFAYFFCLNSSSSSFYWKASEQSGNLTAHSLYFI